MKFVCPNCGEVKPKQIYYSCPTQGDCPTCNTRLTDQEGGIKFMSEEEARKLRPEFYKDEENEN